MRADSSDDGALAALGEYTSSRFFSGAVEGGAGQLSDSGTEGVVFIPTDSRRLLEPFRGVLYEEVVNPDRFRFGLRGVA